MIGVIESGAMLTAMKRIAGTGRSAADTQAAGRGHGAQGQGHLTAAEGPIAGSWLDTADVGGC